ncbi:MAG: GTP 3',8-cyclase MoaA [Dehalococcoidia bacterium]|nr:GTP 3',8-cyclase MoaA [Dehalococcoidia bacterium]MDP7470160.1 GTP 3',8-cyclase MoaA [Dehalococcoidia bacterium]
MTGLSDSFHRPINYLRISVTDRCNFNCRYCRPPDDTHYLARKEVLSYEEIVTVVQAVAGLGVNKVRLTGGEPLVRRGLGRLVDMLSAIPGIDDLALTTNGRLLSRFALRLKKAGLHRVNVSLDTLRPGRFAEISGRDDLNEVLQGLERAERVGLQPVKINMVVMGGVNDDEVLEFGRLTIDRGWNVRFIELMPFGRADGAQFIPVSQVARVLSALGDMEPCFAKDGGGPAKYFRFPGARGTVGFIGAVSEHFCFGCNRLRLTADGKLRPCLMGEEIVDLRPVLRSGAPLFEVREVILQAAALKPAGHLLTHGIGPQDATMSHIGG